MTLMTMRSGARGAHASTTDGAESAAGDATRKQAECADDARATPGKGAHNEHDGAKPGGGFAPFGSRRSGLAVRDMPVRDMAVWDAPVRIHPFVRRAFGPCLFGQHAFSAPNIEIPMPPSSHSAHRIPGSHGECTSD
ncbi:hypothetical protein X977_4176 [Burkholderia pseudomallei MSHR7504]|nr:hypothetical protein X977_4176 [Burkholderia pseudomallei MSHR7504]